MIHKLKYLTLLSLTIGVFTHCGSGSGTENSSSNTGATISNFSSVPDLSSLVDTSNVSSSSISKLLVQGTPTAFINIDGMEPYFFSEGFFANLDSNLSSSTEEPFLEGGAPNPNHPVGQYLLGEGKCMVIENNGRSFQDLAMTGMTACMMKNMPSLNGVDEDLFAKTDADKLVKILVTQPGEGQMNVFIKVHGNESLSSAGLSNEDFKADLHFCNANSESANQTQRISYIKSTGSFSQSEIFNDGQMGSGTFDITAKVDEDGHFDPTQDKVISIKHTQTDPGNSENGDVTFNVEITINGNTITTKQIDAFGGDVHKILTKANFSGTNFTDVAFSSAAFKVEHSFGDETWEHSGAMDWNENADIRYSTVTDSSLLTDVLAINFSTDTFYSEGPVAGDTTIDATLFPCDAEPDVTLNFDELEGVEQLFASCQPDFDPEGEGSFGLCWDDSDITNGRTTIDTWLSTYFQTQNQ